MGQSVSISKITAVLSVLGGVAVAVYEPAALGEELSLAAGITIAAIGLWASGAIPAHVTAIGFFLAAIITGLAGPRTAFSGFAASATWLVIGGMILGAASRTTGLAARIARTMSRRFPNSYGGVISGVLFVLTVLAFFMPSSTGRLMLMLPIVIALADQYGLKPGTKGRTGLLLASVFGSVMPGFGILTANVPNMVMIGASETYYNLTPIYGEYLMLHFPALTVLKMILLWVIVVVLFPYNFNDAEPAPATPEEESAAVTGLSMPEKYLALVLVGALGLWLTDFIHHVSPAWIGLSAAFLCMIPPFKLVTPETFRKDIDFTNVIFIAGALGLGEVISVSGLGDLWAQTMLEIAPLEPGASAKNFAVIVGLSSLTAVVTASPGSPIVLVPLAESMASAAGLTLNAVIMLQMIGIATIWLPFQVPPFIVGASLAKVPLADTTRFCLILAVLTTVLILPLDYLWWLLIGWI